MMHLSPMNPSTHPETGPALNHEMVCAVLTERQTSDCDIKCCITFSFQRKFYVLRASIRVENQYDDFVKVKQDSTSCFDLFRVYINFIR